jgi:hypothetical protein
MMLRDVTDIRQRRPRLGSFAWAIDTPNIRFMKPGLVVSVLFGANTTAVVAASLPSELWSAHGFVD